MCMFFFCKQKTAYDMRISDWSSDVCSSDLAGAHAQGLAGRPGIDAGADVLGELALEKLRDATGKFDHLQPADAGTLGVGQHLAVLEIGRWSCRERVCQYV